MATTTGKSGILLEYASDARDRACSRRRPPQWARPLEREWPSLAAVIALPPRRDDAADVVTVDLAAWEADRLDRWRFDRSVDACGAAGRLRLALTWADAHAFTPERRLGLAREVLWRCQRWAWRRSRHGDFVAEVLLPAYRQLHPPDRPLAQADFAHAVDTWQWTLALEPNAGIAVQAAALLHDMERLSSEVEARIEHLAADYAAFKRAHAIAGAMIVRAFLTRCGAAARLADRVARLVRGHDQVGVEGGAAADADSQLLADADGLSFFALNLDGFVDYYGLDHTRKKLAFTWARMSERGRALVPCLRLPPAVRTRSHACIDDEEEPWSKR